LLWLAASILAGAILTALDFGANVRGQPRQIAAVLLAVLVVGAVRLAAKAMAAKEDSNVLEHAPEMSSLSFPPSSLRK